MKFALKSFGRCLIGDEMGLGKTIQALAICCVYRSDWPVVIICPSALRYNWKEEILKWVPKIHDMDIHLINTSLESIMNNAKFYIISYEMAAKMREKILARGIGIVIADEAHFLKS